MRSEIITVVFVIGSSFPTVTHHYAHPYPTGDQIWERGKNLNAITEGETFSDWWMDDLIYATTVHTSHHFCTNGNLDGYVVIIVVLVFGIDPSCYRMLNKLLMRGLFDLEIPPEHSNCWMTHLTHYTTTIGTKLFSCIESLWETTKKDRKAQNNHIRKIHKLEHKTLVQGHALEDQDNMICKLSSVIALAVSPHSFPFIRLQHAQLNNDPYFSFLKPSHEITRQEDEHKIRQ